MGRHEADHVSVPELGPDERQPETVPDVGIFDGIFSEAPRRLSDVWEGRGDYDDPFVPEEPDEDRTNRVAVEHDQDLLAKRMRADSDANLE